MNIVLKFLLVLMMSLLLYAKDDNLVVNGVFSMLEGDYPQAIKYYTKGCEKLDSRGCYYLGMMYERGDGVKQSYVKAAKFYDKGCNKNDASSCFQLGLLFGNGQGVKKDLLHGIDLFEKACEGEDADACERMGKVYTDGIFREIDLKKAEFLTNKANTIRNSK